MCLSFLKLVELWLLKFLKMAGVIVGHQFFSRAEMVVLGFHCHWMNGIDYMGNAYRKGVMHFSLFLD